MEKFEGLYNEIYEVIYELVRNNVLFKIHVSKWINFIIEDVVTSNEGSHLRLLKEILRDNPFLINNLVTPKLVEMLSHRMINQKTEFLFYEIKYIEIFRLLCIVDEEINTNNQILVLEYFVKRLKTNDITQLYMITLSKKDEDIFT